jgi:predicted lipoprotein
MIRIAILACLLLIAAPAQAAPDYARLNADAVREHVVPRYEALAAATARLDEAAAAFCGGNRTDTAALREAWRGAMAAWEDVQHVRFGPAEWFNRIARFAFWPDPRNVASRQLAELFEKRDPKALSPQGFVTGSVAVQGLTALERELFDPAEAGKFASDPYRCEWLRAVTTNLATMARDIVADWTAPPHDFARAFVAASGGYKDAAEATLDLFKSLHTAVELVADHKLARPLGESAKAARPRLAESWRSETSLANATANLRAARDLFDRLRPGVSDAALVKEILARFDGAAAAAAAVKGSLESAVADPARRTAVERLRREAFALKRLIAERLTVALDLALGFNALDGD